MNGKSPPRKPAMRNLYSITISLRPMAQNPLYIHRVMKRVLRRELNKMSKHYVLVPEFSDKGRLHYHGTIQITDKLKMYNNKYKLDRLGFTKMDPLKTFKDHLRWTLYCRKNFGWMRAEYDIITYMRLRRYTALCKRSKKLQSRLLKSIEKDKLKLFGVIIEPANLPT